MAILWCVGCTEYIGPPASPEYWKPPPPDPNPPEALLSDPPQPPEQHSAPMPQVAPVDPPDPPRARSISLGYTGDGVLTGGITRDTQIEPRGSINPQAYSNWQDYANAPKWRSASPRFRNSNASVPYPSGYGAGYGIPGAAMGAAAGCPLARTPSW